MAMVSKFFAGFSSSTLRALPELRPIAQRHLLAAAACGQESDAGLDQPHVQFGVRLSPGAVKRDLRASAEAEAVRRSDNWARTELDGGSFSETRARRNPPRPTRRPGWSGAIA